MLVLMRRVDINPIKVAIVKGSEHVAVIADVNENFAPFDL